jgi:hypothetical protein
MDRARFTAQTLLQYNGQWVAFSADGRRIVASAAELLELDRLVIATGEDPASLGIERISDDDRFLGGIELE